MLFIFVTGDVLLVTRHSSFVTRHSTHVTRVHPWLTVVKKERGVTPFGMTPLFFNFYELSDVSLYALTKYTLFTSYLTLTVIVFFLPPAVNVTFALPAFFLALILNFASPLASVILLAGVIVMTFLPAVFIFAVTVSPATTLQVSPLTVTVTVLLFFFLSFKLAGCTETDAGSHVGVGVSTGDPVGVGVVESGGARRRLVRMDLHASPALSGVSDE